MNFTSITKKDLLINFDSRSLVDFEWEAEYKSERELSIKISTDYVFDGSETMTLKFINYKTFRGPKGG